MKAKENVNEATHLLEQAKAGFYEMDKKQRELMSQMPKPVYLNSDSHNYLEAQRPEMLKILLPEVFKEKEEQPPKEEEKQQQEPPTPEPEEVDDLLVNVEAKLSRLGSD